MRHVLGGMHGEIERAGKQLLLDLLGEKPLAADRRQRAVGDPVALGGEHHDLEHILRQAMGGHQPVAGFMRLGQRQRAAARADPVRFRLHPASTIVTGCLVNRIAPCRKQSR